MAQSLSNLPIGAKIKFGKHSINGETAQPIIWWVVAKNHYDSSSITLFPEKVIDIRIYDADEPTNPITGRGDGGNNRYSVSNIHQWLNSNQLDWYVPQHDYDAPPDYQNRPGFLYNFTNAEYNAIKTTTVKSNLAGRDGGGYDTITAKIFLPACEELNLLNNNEVKDNEMGRAWGYPSDIVQVRGVMTSQVKAYTQVDIGEETAINYFVRNVGSSVATVVEVFGYISSWAFASGVGAATYQRGIRPVMNLSSTLSISDTTDSDGCYTAIWNSAPPVPSTINVPTLYGGKTAIISWSKVTDPDGDTVTYQLESSINGGAYTTIYSGSNLSYTSTISFGMTSVQYRVRAMDSKGATSGYIASGNKSVINNNAPVISSSWSSNSVGTRSSEFAVDYTVTDVESSTLTVTEEIDGVKIRSYTATSGVKNEFSVKGTTWLTLSIGQHTIRITASDGLDNTVKTFTFVKSVSSFTVQNNNPIAASTRPSRIKVSVIRNIPAEATLKIEVCNNGFDSSPTWEDATSSMNSGLVYLFSNTTKTSTNWGVLIRVTVNRNGGSGECYVSSIGGNFE